MTITDWRSFLETWSRELIEAGASPDLPTEVVESGWLGFPGATDEQLSLAEARLGIGLPPSYREFLAVADGEEDFEAYRRRYGITHVLLPIAEDKRFLPLAARLINSGKWDLLYCDGAAALMADPGLGKAVPLDSLPEGHILPRTLRERYGANPRLLRLAAANLRELLAAAGRPRAAADLFPFENAPP